MIDETIQLVQTEVTIPKIIVGVIFYGIIHGIYSLGKHGQREIDRHRRQLQTQHRKHNHGAAFADCQEGNCEMHSPTVVRRLRHLRQV